MSTEEVDGEGCDGSNRNSEIRERDLFLELLSQVQDNRYESQRYTLKAGSSDGSYNDESRDGVSIEIDTMTNGAIPNGDLPARARIPSIEVSPTAAGPLNGGSISDSEPHPNDPEVGGEGEKEREGDGDREPVSVEVGRDSLSPPPVSLPQSNTSTPSRRSMEALRKLLLLDPPYPMVMEPPDGGYWIEQGDYESALGSDGIWMAPEISTEHYRLDVDQTAFMYGRFFAGKEHRNFISHDSNGEPILFSMKMEEDYQGTTVRMILRTPKDTIHRALPLSQIPDQVKEPEEFIRFLSGITGEELQVEKAVRIMCPKAPELIQKFDEHTVSEQHKVGIIYQKFGQTSEEELFSNVSHSPAMQEFLELLGDKVRLKGFKGYRGGLDVASDQTGEYSFFTEFKDREVMFHVSTMLPYDPADTQHVQRKRHIGNDIVVIAFQDENTPFCPNMIRSHFVHSYIVVQVEHPNTDHTVYKVSVTAKDEVPEFGPPLPDPAVFQKCSDFREWILTKVLNAEFNCHEAPDFRRLSCRTRSQLFRHLVEDIAQSMEDVDLGGRKFLSSFDITSSPRQARRRRTLTSLFSKKDASLIPKRKSISGASPRNYRKNLSASGRDMPPVTVGSTPDLSIMAIEEDPRNSPPSVHSLTLAEDGTEKAPSPESGGGSMKAKVKRRFTFRKDKDKDKDKKKARAMSEDHTASLGDYARKRKKNSVPFKQDSSENSSVTSSSNWSIPYDLSLERRMGRASLENLAFAIPEDSTDLRARCRSNPAIHKRREGQTEISISGMRMDGPLTADVATQVNSEATIFKFPSPMSPLSSKEEEGSFSLPSTPTKPRRGPHSVRRLLTNQEIQDRYNRVSPSSKMMYKVSKVSQGVQCDWEDGRRKPHHRSSSPVLMDSGSRTHELSPVRRTVSSDMFLSNGISFEEEAEGLENSDRLMFRAESTESVSSEVDDMYDSMLRSLQALTAEVTRLRRQNLTLCTENARFASQNRRLLGRYQDAKLQVSKLQESMNVLELKLRLYQPNFPKEDNN